MPTVLDRPAPFAAAVVTGHDPEPLRVVVADDHPLYRQGVARAVRRHPELTLVGEATDGDEALALIAALEPDVAVLDHRMPGLTGTEICQLLLREAPELPTAILVVSAFEDVDLVWNAVAAGAAGYLGKTASHDQLCAAIVDVGRGGTAWSPLAAQALPRPDVGTLGA